MVTEMLSGLSCGDIEIWSCQTETMLERGASILLFLIRCTHGSTSPRLEL